MSHRTQAGGGGGGGGGGGPFAGWERLTWVFQKRPGLYTKDGVGRLREAVRADGQVEVRWADWSTSVVAAASHTENKLGWDGLSGWQTLSNQKAQAENHYLTTFGMSKRIHKNLMEL